MLFASLTVTKFWKTYVYTVNANVRFFESYLVLMWIFVFLT